MSESGGVDGDAREFDEEIADRADVIFVAVSEDQGFHVFAIFLEEGEIGNDIIDAEQFSIGEHHSAINDDYLVAVTNGHDVHAELAESAERHNLQLLICQRAKVSGSNALFYRAMAMGSWDEEQHATVSIA